MTKLGSLVGESEAMRTLLARLARVLYFDKATNQVIANDGTSQVSFDPSHLDDATIASLARSVIPEALLWSWKGVLCRAACWGLAAGGCAAVAVA